MTKSDLTGFSEFLLSLDALPTKYESVRAMHRSDATKRARGGQRGFGPSAERVVIEILELEGLAPRRPRPLFHAKYVRPDVELPGDVFLEVTKWGDSNKLSSMVANGLFVKSAIPNAHYFAVVASYGVPESWTYNPDVDFYLGELAKSLPTDPIDGYCGFPKIDALVSTIKLLSERSRSDAGAARELAE